MVFHDHPRRGRSEGGGEEALEADAHLEQLRHRELGGRLGPEQLAHDGLGVLVTHVVMDETLDLGRGQDRGRAGRRPVLARRPHEGGGLSPIVDVLLGEQRDDDEESHVEEEGPEDPVADVVEALEPEEGGGPQRAEAEGAVGQEGFREHVLLAEGRDDEGVEPHEEARRDPREGALAIAAPPVQPE